MQAATHDSHACGHALATHAGRTRTDVPCALFFCDAYVQVGDGKLVEHALASGRIANSCRDVTPFHDAAKASGKGGIMNPPITLPTPGKVYRPAPCYHNCTHGVTMEYGHHLSRQQFNSQQHTFSSYYI